MRGGKRRCRDGSESGSRMRGGKRRCRSGGESGGVVVGLVFYYSNHAMNRFIPHVHRARPLNGFESGPNLAENTIEYVLLIKWDWKSIFSSANPSSPKLPLNGFTEWNFLRNKERAYQNWEQIWLCGGCQSSWGLPPSRANLISIALRTQFFFIAE